MKEREEKAEADNVIVTLKVTYQCVCEDKGEEHETRPRENEKSSSNRVACEGESKKTEKNVESESKGASTSSITEDK